MVTVQAQVVSDNDTEDIRLPRLMNPREISLRLTAELGNLGRGEGYAVSDREFRKIKIDEIFGRANGLIGEPLCNIKRAPAGPLFEVSNISCRDLHIAYCHNSDVASGLLKTGKSMILGPESVISYNTVSNGGTDRIAIETPSPKVDRLEMLSDQAFLPQHNSLVQAFYALGEMNVLKINARTFQEIGVPENILTANGLADISFNIIRERGNLFRIKNLAAAAVGLNYRDGSSVEVAQNGISYFTPQVVLTLAKSTIFCFEELLILEERAETDKVDAEAAVENEHTYAGQGTAVQIESSVQENDDLEALEILDEVAEITGRIPEELPDKTADILTLLGQEYGINIIGRAENEERRFNFEFTNPFKIMALNGSDSGCIGIIACVETKQGRETRVFYQSPLAVTFELLPSKNSLPFLPGRAQTKSDRFNLPAEVQKLFAKALSEAKMGELCPPEFLARLMVNNENFGDYQGGKTKFIKSRTILPAYPDEYKLLCTNQTLMRPPSEVKVYSGLGADFSKPMSYEFRSDLYGRVAAYVYPSGDGRLEYIFCCALDLGMKTWIEQIAELKSISNEFAIPICRIEPEEAVTRLLVNKNHFPRKYTDQRQPLVAEHFSAWEYIREISEIQRFYLAKSLSMPG
jgi:hypothetical protein